MTYSVVMLDPESGALGVAVQSHWFNVAGVVPWAQAGVGAVATQSLAEPMYGPNGLELMGQGVTAPEALARLLSTDETPEVRQVAMVDAAGAVAGHTGESCIPFASHITGEGWSVQGNIMRTEEVVPAMAEAASAAAGPLPARLFAVLRAAEQAGGDLRGSQSAAILVADKGPVLAVRLSVEDHPDPIAELERLLEVRDMYEEMRVGGVARAGSDVESAAAAYERAARSPHSHAEVLFWQAYGLATLGREAEAGTVLERAVEANPDMRELLERVTSAGLVDGEIVDRLLAQL